MRNMTLGVLFSLVFFAVSQTQADLIKIAGNDLDPEHGINSYWGMTSDIERAFPFATISGGPFYVEELQVLAFYWNYQSGSDARFTINWDDNGLPGEVIGTFETESIPIRPWPETSYTGQILSIHSDDEILLYPDTSYWLLGRTLDQHFNWHLGVNAFDTVAYRVDGGSWVTTHQYGNVTAFTIMGSEIPEPATLSLLALGSLLAIRRRRSSC